MKYYGYFRDIKENALYTVNITTEKGTASKQITLTDSPFITEMESNDDTIYRPLKGQTATVSVLTDELMTEVFTGKAQGTKVELFKQVNKQNILQWTGYVEPNLYSMGYDKVKEVVEINCIDGLSTLKYFPYLVDNKQILSIKDIICFILNKCNCYNYFCISDNSYIEDPDESIIDKLYLSEQNFYEAKDEGETDEDVAWDMWTVLEQIAQYLGVTAVAEKDIVYFLDYDAMAKGDHQYYKYNLKDKTKIKVGTKNEPYDISHSLSGCSLSIGDVYNKATIVAELNTFDNILPNPFDNIKNITADSDPLVGLSINFNAGVYGEVVKGYDGNMEVLVDRVYDPQHKKYTDYHALALKLYDSDDFTLYRYNLGDKLNYTDTKTLQGAVLARYFVKKMDKETSDNFLLYLERLLGLETDADLDKWFSDNEISSFEFEDYIMLLNPTQNHISNSLQELYPYFETKGGGNAFYGGDNSYLIISGSYIFHYFDDDPYPIPDSADVDIREGRYFIDKGQAYILCKLQLGDYYWDGNLWTKEAKTFKLPFLKMSASEDDRRADNIMFKENKFPNTVSWRIGTKEEGYMIPTCNNVYYCGLPDGYVIQGTPKFTMYKPFDPNYHSSGTGIDQGQWYKMNRVFLKDFGIKSVIADSTFGDNNDTDTKYSIIIDETYVKELGELTYKINTWDNKKPNYSGVVYKSGTNYLYLDRVWNKALSEEVEGMEFEDQVSDGSLRFEWWKIYKIYKQYKQPTLRLTVNPHNQYTMLGVYTTPSLADKLFIADSINTDYRNNVQEINLIEKV